ncbi:hypothetical protein C6P44_002032, partial [Monosporozyma unispora]
MLYLNSPHTNLLTGLLLFTFLKNILADNILPEACILPGIATPKGNLNFYHYPYDDEDSFNDVDFLGGGYAKEPLLYSTQVTGSQVYFRSAEVNANGPYLGLSQFLTNFTAEYVGYFLAPKSGLYSFNFEYVDDSAVLTLGAGSAFGCCDSKAEIDSKAFLAGKYLPPFTADNVATGAKNVYLRAGYYYPVKLVYINFMGYQDLVFFTKIPGMGQVNGFGDYFYSYPDTSKVSCPPKKFTYTLTYSIPPLTTTTIITTTTDPAIKQLTTSTTTSRSTDPDGNTTPEVIIVVHTPPPVYVTTSTTTTNPSIKQLTTTTSTTTITDAKSNATPEVVIIVETPPPLYVTSSTTTTNPNIKQLTTTTSTTTITDPKGNTTPEVLIIIETPPPNYVTSYTT